MSSRSSKPRWGLAYGLFLLLVLLLLLIEWLAPPQALKEVAQIASVLLTFALLSLWVRVNALALYEEGRQQEQKAMPAPTPGQRHFRQVMQFHSLAKRRPETEEARPSPSQPTS